MSSSSGNTENPETTNPVSRPLSNSDASMGEKSLTSSADSGPPSVASFATTATPHGSVRGSANNFSTSSSGLSPPSSTTTKAVYQNRQEDQLRLARRRQNPSLPAISVQDPKLLSDGSSTSSAKMRTQSPTFTTSSAATGAKSSASGMVAERTTSSTNSAPFSPSGSGVFGVPETPFEGYLHNFLQLTGVRTQGSGEWRRRGSGSDSGSRRGSGSSTGEKTPPNTALKTPHNSAPGIPEETPLLFEQATRTLSKEELAAVSIDLFTLLWNQRLAIKGYVARNSPRGGRHGSPVKGRRSPGRDAGILATVVGSSATAPPTDTFVRTASSTISGGSVSRESSSSYLQSRPNSVLFTPVGLPSTASSASPFSGRQMSSSSMVSSRAYTNTDFSIRPMNHLTRYKGEGVRDDDGELSSICDFEVIAELGRGAFGAVSLVVDSKGDSYAIKTLFRGNRVVHDLQPPSGSTSPRESTRELTRELTRDGFTPKGGGRSGSSLLLPLTNDRTLSSSAKSTSHVLGDSFASARSPRSHRDPKDYPLSVLSAPAGRDPSSARGPDSCSQSPSGRELTVLDVPESAVQGIVDGAGALEKEILLMTQLSHRHIVRLYAVIEDPIEEQTHLIMQYIPNGQLSTRATSVDCNVNYKLVDFGDALHYMSQVSAGLDYLHSHQVIHRDVKPENIMMGDNRCAYLADFGVSDVITEVHKKSRKKRKLEGTAHFFSPELIADRGAVVKYGKQADVFAFGVTLYAVVYGELPWQGPHLPGVTKAIAEEPLTFPSFETPANKSLNKKEMSTVSFASGVSAVSTAQGDGEGGSPDDLLSPLTTASTDEPFFAKRRKDSTNTLECGIDSRAFDPQFQHLVCQLLEKDPRKRMTLREFRHHPFVVQHRKTEPSEADEEVLGQSPFGAAGTAFSNPQKPVAESGVPPLAPTAEPRSSIFSNVSAATDSTNSLDRPQDLAATMAPVPSFYEMHMVPPSETMARESTAEGSPSANIDSASSSRTRSPQSNRSLSPGAGAAGHDPMGIAGGNNSFEALSTAGSTYMTNQSTMSFTAQSTMIHAPSDLITNTSSGGFSASNEKPPQAPRPFGRGKAPPRTLPPMGNTESPDKKKAVESEPYSPLVVGGSNMGLEKIDSVFFENDMDLDLSAHLGLTPRISRRDSKTATPRAASVCPPAPSFLEIPRIVTAAAGGEDERAPLTAQNSDYSLLGDQPQSLHLSATESSLLGSGSFAPAPPGPSGIHFRRVMVRRRKCCVSSHTVSIVSRFAAKIRQNCALTTAEATIQRLRRSKSTRRANIRVLSSYPGDVLGKEEHEEEG